MTDTDYMRWALRLARRATGRTRPNPLVGCVLVRDGQVVGSGWHRQAGGPHAEVVALSQAGILAQGATAYVTLEPCSHFGRTPPCADGLIRAGVTRVVAAMTDPNPRVAGQGMERLRQAGIVVAVGLCQEEATALNRPFLTWITQGRPLVTLKMAASLDGKIATRTGESQWITGPEARTMAHRLRDTHDAVLTGIGTVLADDPLLNCRLPGGRDPIRVVVDSRLRIPPTARIFAASKTAPVWIATIAANPEDKFHNVDNYKIYDQVFNLNKNLVKFLPCDATPDGQVDVVDLMQKLGKKEITSVLAECGGRLAGSLLQARLIDRIAWFVAPKLIGSQEAPGVFAGFGVERLDDAPQLVNAQWRHLGDDWLLEADIQYPSEETRCSPD